MQDSFYGNGKRTDVCGVRLSFRMAFYFNKTFSSSAKQRGKQF
jgi:hypothetical protein